MIPFGGIVAQAPPVAPIRVSVCDPNAGATLPPEYVPGGSPAGPLDDWLLYGERLYSPPIQEPNPALGITYANTSSLVIREIEFGLVSNGTIVVRLRDIGSFAPGVQIKHKFRLNPNVVPLLQTGIPRCVALHVTYEDGTTWNNPP